MLREVEPWRPAQLVTLSPDQVEEAYCIVEAVAERVRMKGRVVGCRAARAECEDCACRDVWRERPMRPISWRGVVLEGGEMVAEESSAHSQVSSEMTYSLLSSVFLG